MDHRLIEGLMEVIAPLIKSYVDDRIAKDIAPLRAKIAEYQAMPVEKGEPGAPGRDVDPAEVAALVSAEVTKAVSAIEKPADGKSVTVDDVRPMLEEMVAALPKPENGKDADPVQVANLLVDRMPVPADGKSVTIDDVRPLLKEMVAALPLAENGKDADPEIVRAMIVEEVAKHKPADGKPGEPGLPGKSVDIQDLMPAIATQVEMAVVSEFEKIVLPEGKQGEPGKSVTVDDVRPMLEEMVKALPPAQDGKDADPAEVAALIIEDVVKLIPVPPDGKSVTMEDVLPALEEMVEKRVAALPKAKDGEPGRDGDDGVGVAGAIIGRAGELVLTLSDGTVKDLGVIIGKDGEPGVPGKDGKDGLSLKDFSAEQLPDGTVVFKLESEGVTKTEEFKFPQFEYRGIWKDDQSYQKGHGVTLGGSFFIAKRDTLPKEKPEIAIEAWQLAVKKGRDGKDGIVKMIPPPGPVSVPGAKAS